MPDDTYIIRSRFTENRVKTLYVGRCRLFGVIVDGDGVKDFEVIVRDGLEEVTRFGVKGPMEKYAQRIIGYSRDHFVPIYTSLNIETISNGTGSATILFSKLDFPG